MKPATVFPAKMTNPEGEATYAIACACVNAADKIEKL